MAKIESHVELFPILSTVFPAMSSRQFGHNNLFHAQGMNSELIWQLHGFPVFLSLSNHTVLKLIKKQPPVRKKNQKLKSIHNQNSVLHISNQNKNNSTSKTSAAVTKVTGLGFGLL